jgi:predicted kinase
MTGIDPRLILMVGAPGSGKTRYAATHYPPARIISSDRAREFVCGNPNDQDATFLAHRLVSEAVRYRLSRVRQPVVVDATNSDQLARLALLEIAQVCKVAAEVVVMTTPLQLCLIRNAGRPGPRAGEKYGKRVPDAFVRTAYRAIVLDLPGMADEGFALVTKVDGS